MLPRLAQPREQRLKIWGIAIALVLTLALFMLLPAPSPILSRWAGPHIAADALPQPQAKANPIKALALPRVSPLDRYNQDSTLLDSQAGGRARLFRRAVAGGSIAYFVVMLGPQVHIEVLNADGATPGSDATGDTIWTDGGQHLASVAEIAQAPYAARNAMTLLGAMAFGFHGDVRTSDEGTVVINRTIYRVNPGRAALCISSDGQASIGLFDAQALRNCEQAIGAGPVILWQGKIANPDIDTATDTFVPFNPLGEDFVQLDWRRTVYAGGYPKSVIGVGKQHGGQAYLVMLISDGVSGMDLASQLRDMGCTEALGGDDDSSTQAVWRGEALQSHSPRGVPDALAVYIRK